MMKDTKELPTQEPSEQSISQNKKPPNTILYSRKRDKMGDFADIKHQQKKNNDRLMVVGVWSWVVG